MKHTPFKSQPSLLLGAFANVSVLNYAPGRTWYRAAAVGVLCTSKNKIYYGITNPAFQQQKKIKKCASPHQ